MLNSQPAPGFAAWALITIISTGTAAAGFAIGRETCDCKPIVYERKGWLHLPKKLTVEQRPDEPVPGCFAVHHRYVRFNDEGQPIANVLVMTHC